MPSAADLVAVHAEVAVEVVPVEEVAAPLGVGAVESAVAAGGRVHRSVVPVAVAAPGRTSGVAGAVARTLAAAPAAPIWVAESTDQEWGAANPISEPTGRTLVGAIGPTWEVEIGPDSGGEAPSLVAAIAPNLAAGIVQTSVAEIGQGSAMETDLASAMEIVQALITACRDLPVEIDRESVMAIARGSEMETDPESTTVVRELVAAIVLESVMGTGLGLGTEIALASIMACQDLVAGIDLASAMETAPESETEIAPESTMAGRGFDLAVAAVVNATQSQICLGTVPGGAAAENAIRSSTTIARGPATTITLETTSTLEITTSIISTTTTTTSSLGMETIGITTGTTAIGAAVAGEAALPHGGWAMGPVIGMVTGTATRTARGIVPGTARRRPGGWEPGHWGRSTTIPATPRTATRIMSAMSDTTIILNPSRSSRSLNRS